MRKKILFVLLLLGLSIHLYSKEPLKILVGSPIRQKPAILKEFLQSLDRLHKESYTLDYFFVDDNDLEESHTLLDAFAQKKGPACTIYCQQKPQEQYVCNETTHFWKEALIWKVAAYKDKMIKHAIDNDYDYLFLIDSDIVLHPYTIEKLIQAKKGIVSNIFWTQWNPCQPSLPQVWLLDHYTLYEHGIGENVSGEEIQRRQAAFLAKMRTLGTYEVGGLGACTLIDRETLQKGISFKRIKNITMWGEDRHFCVRAAALDIPLFVDTHYPAYHIYRESSLAGVGAFITSCEANLSNQKT